MLVGLNCAVEDYSSHFVTFPGVRVTRVFSQPTVGILPWTHPKVANLPRTVAPHMSFKDWPDDVSASRMVSAWLDAAPGYLLDSPLLLPEVGFSALLTYLHEPENDTLTPAVFQHRQEVLHDTVRGHRKGHLVAVMPIQTLQWTQAASTSTATKGDGNVFQWWAGVGDFCGIDCYANSWEPTYPDPVKFLELPLRLAAGAGRPLWVPELGAVRLATDPDGSKRAAWIRTVAGILRSLGCAAVSWWCASGSNGKSIHLDDAASSNAWRDVIARRSLRLAT